MSEPNLPPGVAAVAIEGLIDENGELTPDPSEAVFGELKELDENGVTTFVMFDDSADEAA